jgi:hypothetical protein
MKEQILKLYHQGKSYRQIQQIVGCSTSTISFHCGKGQKRKSYKRRQIATQKFREQLKQEAGGCCKICGYNKCLSALDFHHNNDDKTEMVSRLIRLKGFEAARQEAKKCILICANCHRELHDKEQKAERNQPI